MSWILNDLKFETWRVAYEMRFCLMDLKAEHKPEITSRMDKILISESPTHPPLFRVKNDLFLETLNNNNNDNNRTNSFNLHNVRLY